MEMAQFVGLTVGAFQIFQAIVPIDTGNMRYNATTFNSTGTMSCTIKVDGSIAPYAVYTNEPWLSPRWHGKTNPNEGWWNEWCDTFMKRLATKLQGNLK